MVFSEWSHLLVFLGLIAFATPLLGSYIASLFSEEAPKKIPVLSSLEIITYRIGGIDPKREMTWKEYGMAVLLFNALGFLWLFFLQLLQGALPLNPENFGAVSLALAYNTASSFVTNTDWQAYAGETTYSYLTAMLGMTAQNFLSAGTGLAVLMALIRSLTRKSEGTIGNFWKDLVRSVLYLLLPLSILMALLLMQEGTVQTLAPYKEVTTLEGGKQTIPLGPVASQIAIKQLGTNGGGFFNANSAHPFENPSALSNLLEMAALLLIPAATVYAYGKMIGCLRHTYILLSVMLLFWILMAAIFYFAEAHIPLFSDNRPYLEGKEVRFGIVNSLIWSVSTTATSNGSVNAMLSSLPPLAGGVCLFNIMLGELIFGGVGVGMLSMIMYVILTVFISGLMVGRTPEYLGKKIEKNEMPWVAAAVLLPGALILSGTGVTCLLEDTSSSLLSQGPHGFSEILYAFSSAAGNNGSAFAGLNANTPYFNIALGTVMLIGRAAILLPSLALAGLMARKKLTPASAGTFSTNSSLFGILLFSVILIVGALTFFPALLLGPIVEHFLMMKGRFF